MFIPVSKFLSILRHKQEGGNAFTRSGAPEVGEKWEAVCQAVADFVEAARENEIVGYETARANLHAMGHAAPVLDIEREFKLIPADGETAAESPAPGVEPLTLSEMTDADVDAFVAALAKLPEAVDPHDAKEA